MRTFDGFKREDGRVGTHSYVAVISGVNCSASVSQFVKDRFRDVQKDYPSATNSLMYRHMAEDMDINCGVVLEGTPRRRSAARSSKR
jgi:altronate hydrolase